MGVIGGSQLIICLSEREAKYEVGGVEAEQTVVENYVNPLKDFRNG